MKISKVYELNKLLINSFCFYKLVNYNTFNIIIFNYKNKKLYFQDKNSLILFVLNNYIYIKKSKFFFKFLKQYVSLIHCFKNLYSKKLFLYGLGFKVTFNEKQFHLSFKIGFSHLKVIKIPLNIQVKITKTLIAAKSLDLNLLSKFIYALCNLKLLNIYKGKGFLLKNKKIKIKLFKK